MSSNSTSLYSFALSEFRVWKYKNFFFNKSNKNKTKFTEGFRFDGFRRHRKILKTKFIDCWNWKLGNLLIKIIRIKSTNAAKRHRVKATRCHETKTKRRCFYLSASFLLLKLGKNDVSISRQTSGPSRSSYSCRHLRQIRQIVFDEQLSVIIIELFKSTDVHVWTKDRTFSFIFKVKKQGNWVYLIDIRWDTFLTNSWCW